MKKHDMRPTFIDRFAASLRLRELSDGTISKYTRDVGNFYARLEGRPVTKETAALWREQLILSGYSAVTVNSMIASLNSFFRFMDWEDCLLRTLRIQKRIFRDKSRELTRSDYDRLVSSARKLGKERLALIIETICSTGIRVSELRYITAQSLRSGRADISLKGKVRTILLPGKLVSKLKKYAVKQKIASGEIFLTGSGRSLSRKQIWAEMKALCVKAGIEAEKVFPHNLRHLFARTFYNVCKDISKLADILGHSNIETTRIYLISSGSEHIKQLEALKLIN